MRCENIYCVYQQDNVCYHESVELDGHGCCKRYAPVPIEEETLFAIKKMESLARERRKNQLSGT